MGKIRFNLKARQNADIIIDNSSLKTLKVDLGSKSEYGGEDQSNIEVLPNKKRETKIKKIEGNITRILSKKQRKLLEKVVDKKQKKQNRSSLLDSLAKVQIEPTELNSYTKISQTQTKGLKKHFREQEFGVSTTVKKRKIDNETNEENTKARLSSIAGSNKKKRLKLLNNYDGEKGDNLSSSEENAGEKKDNNVIGFDSSDDEEESKDDENEEETKDDENEKESKNDKNDEEDNADKEENVEPINIENSNEEKTEEKIKNVEEETTEDKIKNEVNETVPLTKEIKPVERKPAVYVHVSRKPEIEIARLKLPILSEEQVIMETINENSIIIIAGETGSGKTTQIPQFLYESGYAVNKMIGITEPRRVAAISMSKRVATEMNLSTDIVSYLIRFEGNITEKTKIKFMTDGVLLKEMENDFTLSKYSVIILDEAHERSIYTDILIGLLSRIVPFRNKNLLNPLKLIIMSATLKIDDFTNNQRLFKIVPPVIKVETRQYPVTIHFNKLTTNDYVKEAYNKIIKIHTKLPEGGILVFLTGQNEVNYLINKLRKVFPNKYKMDNQKQSEQKHTNKETVKNENEVDDDDDFFNDKNDKKQKLSIKNMKKLKKKFSKEIHLPQINLDNYKLPEDDTGADLLDNDNDDFLNSDEDGDDVDDVGIHKNAQPLWLLPLYSLLSSDKQARVFNEPPPNHRLCVISTNIAETSLTIPNIKYVVDSGRQKTRLYDKITGVSQFIVTYTSQAGANQRAGRAGRVCAGHCYRLYSSAVFNNDFENFSIPEMQKKPVDDLMLQMKSMGIDKVINFPFPSPPDLIQLQMAEYRLKLLGALKDETLEKKTNTKVEMVTKLTPLGKAISMFPVAPRYGKMLSLSHQQNLLPYTICIVAALSVQEVLQEVSSSEEENLIKSKWYKKRLSWAGQGNSLYLGDPMILLRAVGASEYAGSEGNLEKFCTDNGLRLKAIIEIRKLRKQLTYEINFNLTDTNLFIDPKMRPPNDKESKYLRQILLAGMGDQIAKKIDIGTFNDKQDKIKYKYAYQLTEIEAPVFIHSSSVLKKELPEWIIYQEIYEIQNGDTMKMFIRGITAIEPEWLPVYVPTLCNLGQPLNSPSPRYDPNIGKMFCHVKGTFGKISWELPQTEIPFPDCNEAFKYFGMFFLNGEICPKLKKFIPDLLTTPSLMIKPYSKLVPRTEILQKCFMSRNIKTKEQLLDMWKINSNFLLFEYQNWLPESAHTTVAIMWPPID